MLNSAEADSRETQLLELGQVLGLCLVVVVWGFGGFLALISGGFCLVFDWLGFFKRR